MSKLLVVFGATGQQGGSVIDCVINDAQLSKQYKVRGVTRDPSKPTAQALQKAGVEMIAGEMDDIESLKHAMQGAHTVFATSATIYDDKTRARGIDQGKALADAAIAAGAQYFIWSSLPNVTKVSGGKYKQVEQFDSKADIEEYVRGLPIKSAFFAPGSFMQNFRDIMAPHPTGDGAYAISNVVTPQTQLPLIEAAADSGKFVAAILAEPEKFEGKSLSAATRLYSMEEIVETISKASGKTVKYNQLPESVFRGFLPPAAADNLVEMLLYFRDFGYYGPKMEEEVEWAAKNARGKLTTLEEYLEKNPLDLK